MSDLLRAMLLLGIANVMPWALAWLCRGRCAAPLDLGLRLADGARLLGDHKTWRGLAGSVVACALVASALRLDWRIGAAFGVISLSGDAIASCLKRRVALPPGSEVAGLDQLPEALLPLIVLAGPLRLGALQVIVVAGSFTVLDLLFTRLRHRSR
jgi:CDP-diglyceride synthetase